MRTSSSSPSIHVSAGRVGHDGDFCFEVQAESLARASREQAWAVLTDYEHLPDFIPDLVSCRVIARDEDRILLEQQSRVSLLFISQLLWMQLQVEEQPPSVIDIRQVVGDMRHYAAHWELEPEIHEGMECTRIRFSGMLEPKFFVPYFIGAPLMQTSVRQTVEAVVREIEHCSAH